MEWNNQQQQKNNTWKVGQIKFPFLIIYSSTNPFFFTFLSTVLCGIILFLFLFLLFLPPTIVQHWVEICKCCKEKKLKVLWRFLVAHSRYQKIQQANLVTLLCIHTEHMKCLVELFFLLFIKITKYTKKKLNCSVVCDFKWTRAQVLKHSPCSMFRVHVLLVVCETESSYNYLENNIATLMFWVGVGGYIHNIMV